MLASVETREGPMCGSMDGPESGAGSLRVCDGLNKNGPHGLIGRGTIRRYSFVGGSVSLGGGL